MNGSQLLMNSQIKHYLQGCLLGDQNHNDRAPPGATSYCPILLIRTMLLMLRRERRACQSHIPGTRGPRAGRHAEHEERLSKAFLTPAWGTANRLGPPCPGLQGSCPSCWISTSTSSWPCSLVLFCVFVQFVKFFSFIFSLLPMCCCGTGLKGRLPLSNSDGVKMAEDCQGRAGKGRILCFGSSRLS